MGVYGEELTPGQRAFLLAGVEEHQRSLREVRERAAERLDVIPLRILRERLAKVDPEVRRPDPEISESEKRLLDGNR